MARELSTGEFAKLVRNSIERGLGEKHLADQAGVSLAAVEQWTEGKNVPSPAARRVIVDWIEQQLETDVDDILSD